MTTPPSPFTTNNAALAYDPAPSTAQPASWKNGMSTSTPPTEDNDNSRPSTTAGSADPRYAGAPTRTGAP